jgi:hypothetical protein
VKWFGIDLGLCGLKFESHYYNNIREMMIYLIYLENPQANRDI